MIVLANNNSFFKPFNISQSVKNEYLLFHFTTKLSFKCNDNLTLKFPFLIFPLFQNAVVDQISIITTNIHDNQTTHIIEKRPNISAFSIPLTTQLQPLMIKEIQYLISIPLPNLVDISSFVINVETSLFIEPNQFDKTIEIPFYVKDVEQQWICGSLTSTNDNKYQSVSCSHTMLTMSLDSNDQKSVTFNEFYPRPISQNEKNVLYVKLFCEDSKKFVDHQFFNLNKNSQCLIQPPNSPQNSPKELIFVLDFSSTRSSSEIKSTILRFLNYFIFSMPLSFVFNVTLLTDFTQTPAILFKESQFLTNETWKQFTQFVSLKIVPNLIQKQTKSQPSSTQNFLTLFQLLDLPPVNERFVFLFVENSLPLDFNWTPKHPTCYVTAFGCCTQLSFPSTLKFYPFPSPELFHQHLEKIFDILQLPHWNISVHPIDTNHPNHTPLTLISESFIEKYQPAKPNHKPYFVTDNRVTSYFKQKSPIWWEFKIDRLFKHLTPDTIVDQNNNDSIDQICDIIGIKGKRFNQQLLLSLIFSFIQQEWKSNFGPLRNQLLRKIYQTINIITNGESNQTIYLAQHILKNPVEFNQHLTKLEHNIQVPQNYSQIARHQTLLHNQRPQF